VFTIIDLPPITIGDKRIERIEPRSYAPDASVDPTEARRQCVLAQQPGPHE